MVVETLMFPAQELPGQELLARAESLAASLISDV